MGINIYLDSSRPMILFRNCWPGEKRFNLVFHYFSLKVRAGPLHYWFRTSKYYINKSLFYIELIIFYRLFNTIV